MARDFILRGSWLWTVLLAFLTTPVFAAFQVTTATALPATVSAGKTVALAVSVQSSIAASNMVVDLELYNAAGAKVGQTYNQAQNFAAAKAIKYAWNYVAPAAAGKYTLKIGVFAAGWASLAYWNNSAASFTVSTAALPVNGACGSSNAQPLPSAPTSNLCSTGTASAVSGSGPWKWSCAGKNGGTTASCSATEATAQNQQHGLIPSGLPSTFFIGLAAQPGVQTTWVHNSGVPWAVCYQYLSSGVSATQTWVTHWGTNFAFNYAVSAHAAGCIPEFTYYQIVPSGGEGAAAEQSTLKNAAIMADYYKDFTALMQQMQKYGGKALVHVEPDMWAYLQTLNSKPSLLSASVASSGNADVAGYPNTVAGFGQALLHLRDLYAPNVIMAAHVSTWLWGSSTDPSLNVSQIAKNDAAFMTGLGNWDLFFTDVADRDSAYYQFVVGDATHWWDATNQKYPNFNRLNVWAGAFTAAAQKRLVIWQIPVGNTLMRTCNNTNHHYQDNREQYWLENYPNNAAISGLAQAGVIGLLFGAGNSGPTQVYDAAGDGITNPAPINGNTGVSAYSDDDGGLLRLNVGKYYSSGATPLQ